MTFVCAGMALAQPNFVPDTNLRNILNAQGVAVSEDGYILVPNGLYMELTIATTADMPPVDLTGLEYIMVRILTISNEAGGSFGAFPAFPQMYDQTDGCAISLLGFNGEAIPPIPEHVLYYIVDHPTSIGNWSISGFPDDQYTSVQLNGIPSTVALPEIIEMVDEVLINGWDLPELPPIGVNVNGLMISEAEGLVEVDLSPYEFYYLTIESCHQLTSLSLPTSLLYSVILQDLPLLTDLSITTTLEYLELNDLPALTSLSIFDCSNYLLVGGLPTEVINAWPTSVRELFITSMGNLDMSDLPDQLEVLGISDCSISDLPNLPTTLRNLNVANTPVATMAPLPSGLEHLRLINTALDCSPVLPNALTTLETDLPCVPNQPPLAPPVNLCSVANSTCPGIYPAVSGHVHLDLDGNGVQDTGEPDAANMTVSIMPSGNLTGTDANGNYTIGLPIGEYMVSLVDGFHPASLVAPLEVPVQLPELGISITGVDFRIVPPPPPPPDLSITFGTDPVPPRPGFQHTLSFRVGVDSYSGPTTVTISIDPLASIITTSFPTTSITNNVITAEGLAPGTLYGVQLQLAPSVPLSTVLQHAASIDQPLEDTIPENNSQTVQRTVVGSYDPNDKQVFPQRLTPEEAATDTVLEYLVRFQNTGTYLAERVVITDTLSADLRWDTFRFLESSHPCHWYVSEGVAHFVFNDIMLPDSNANEPESHGHVRFKIRPRVGMVVGESVTNIANIYFDFNEPVITDPCLFAVEVPTSIGRTAMNGVTLHPNPTDHVLNIGSPDDRRYTAEILTMDGRTVSELGTWRSKAAIPVSSLTPGSYLLRLIADDKEQIHLRFVKD